MRAIKATPFCHACNTTKFEVCAHRPEIPATRVQLEWKPVMVFLNIARGMNQF